MKTRVWIIIALICSLICCRKDESFLSKTLHTGKELKSAKIGQAAQSLMLTITGDGIYMTSGGEKWLLDTLCASEYFTANGGTAAENNTALREVVKEQKCTFWSGGLLEPSTRGSVTVAPLNSDPVSAKTCWIKQQSARNSQTEICIGFTIASESFVLKKELVNERNLGIYSFRLKDESGVSRIQEISISISGDATDSKTPVCNILPGDAVSNYFSGLSYLGDDANNGVPVARKYLHTTSAKGSSTIGEIFALNFRKKEKPDENCDLGTGEACFTLGQGSYSIVVSGVLKGIEGCEDLSFSKMAQLVISENCDELVYDIDGNVYHTVKIGTQTWMLENLNTTHYRNGDPIPNVTDLTDWLDLTSGAYCDYFNEPANSVEYGRFYNGYAATDPRNVAPVGWHVPTDAEWHTLILFLDPAATNAAQESLIAGGMLKESGTTHWLSSNADNSSGFTALPAGGRGINDYGKRGEVGIFISTDGKYRQMLGVDTKIWTRTFSLPTGFSIRCLKD